MSLSGYGQHAPIYQSKTIELSLTERGYNCVYLPSHSPERNPIEQFWSKTKYTIKREELLDVDTVFSRILETCNMITHKGLHEYIRHFISCFDDCLIGAPIYCSLFMSFFISLLFLSLSYPIRYCFYLIFVLLSTGRLDYFCALKLLFLSDFLFRVLTFFFCYK